jgi:hypothetical protein
VERACVVSLERILQRDLYFYFILFSTAELRREVVFGCVFSGN